MDSAMTRHVITTARKSCPESIISAKQLALDWQLNFIPRKNQSIAALLSTIREKWGADLRLYVAGEKRVDIYSNLNEAPFFFHPNAAMFRAKHFVRYGTDPLVTAAKIQPGDSIVDATLGLGSDAQLLSLATGESGSVRGLEASVDIARITSMGLAFYQNDFTQLTDAMRRIQVHACHHTDWLEQQSASSYDVIYFDPMFQEMVGKSDGISTLRRFSYSEALTSKAVEEAVRVARKRVVLKDHFKSNRFELLGFNRIRRKSSTVHYGVIEKYGRQGE